LDFYVVNPEQGPGVPHRNFFLLQQPLYVFRQAQEPYVVSNKRAVSADPLGDHFLSQPQSIDQLLVCLGFFNRV
jgi:hypothetical protein